MIFTPNPAERLLVDNFSAQIGVPCVFIRATPTMLKKSIIDASEPLRMLLKENGLIDYGMLGRGIKNGTYLDVSIVAGAYQGVHRCSFYKPAAKPKQDGDPRFWVYGLQKHCHPGDLILIAVIRGSLSFLPLIFTPQVFANSLLPLLPPPTPSVVIPATCVECADHRIALALDNKGVLQELMLKVQRIKEMGWVKTLRPGDTGIGYTFESLLGIRANSSRSPDYKGVEIKCHRSKQDLLNRTRSKKKQTLFSLIPCWGATVDRVGLVTRYGYRDDANQRQALYMTIITTTNPMGWELKLNRQSEQVDVLKDGQRAVFYPYSSLQAALEAKHRHTLFVTAETRGRDDGDKCEEFYYDEVVYREGVSFASFLSLLEEGSVGVDFAIHYKNGHARDHGFLWRIQERDLPRIFKNQHRLL